MGVLPWTVSSVLALLHLILRESFLSFFKNCLQWLGFFSQATPNCKNYSVLLECTISFYVFRVPFLNVQNQGQALVIVTSVHNTLFYNSFIELINHTTVSQGCDFAAWAHWQGANHHHPQLLAPKSCEQSFSVRLYSNSMQFLVYFMPPWIHLFQTFCVNKNTQYLPLCEWLLSFCIAVSMPIHVVADFNTICFWGWVISHYIDIMSAFAYLQVDRHWIAFVFWLVWMKLLRIFII